MMDTKNGGQENAPPDRASRAARRAEKLAEALRANLLKRKQQKRGRAAPADLPEDTAK